jgi:hypothetical protein
MRGSAGGLARIDAIFGGHGYDKTFSGAPVPFGAFPSLHAGCSTMEALFLSHFFPKGRPFYWLYVFLLYWSTMVRPPPPPPLSLSLSHRFSSLSRARARSIQQRLTRGVWQYLTHHYLIDLVAGGSLSCTFFYYYLSKMPDELRHPTARPLPPYRATSTQQQQFGDNSIPLDEESGLPKPFAHHAAGATNGHANGYGGWEAEEEEDQDEGGAKSGVESLADEARMYVPTTEGAGNGLQRTKSPLRRD